MNKKLMEKIENIKNMSVKELAEKFKCKPSEICIGDYIASKTNDIVCPYKVILGFANFENSEVRDLGNLEYVYGKTLKTNNGIATDVKHNPIYLGLNLRNSKIRNLGKLKKVYGTLHLNPYIKSLNNVTFLGSNLHIHNSNLEDLGMLEVVHGILSLEDDVTKCKISSLGNLRKVGDLHVKTKSIRDLGNLEEVGDIHLYYTMGERVVRFFSKNFDFVDNKFIRNDKEYKF